MKKNNIKNNKIEDKREKVKCVNSHKSMLFILLLGVCLLFTGCSSTSTDSKSDGFSFPGTSSGSSSGGGGVELSFSEGRPRTEFYKDEEVAFAFVFSNAQIHPITDLVVRTSGFEKGYVSGLSDEYNIDTIPAANSNTGKAGIYAMSSSEQPKVTVSSFEHKYNFNPTFDYCYSAETTFIEQICVKSKDKNMCDVDFEEYKTQNGPVSVTIDRVESVSDDVTIIFNLKNNGNGKVVTEFWEDEDYANEYEAEVSLGSTVGTCTTKSGKFEMMDGESMFYCNFARSQDSAYSSQVVVKLNYKYQQSIQKTMVVNDLQSSLE